MMLDDLVEGSLGTRIVEETTSLIEQMASNEYWVHHDRGFSRKC